MSNIIIAGNTYSDVPSILVPKADGTGYAEYAEGGGSSSNWTYMGENPELILTYPTETTYLEDTAFNGWTPSTTAKVIVAASNYSPTFVADMENYEYIVDQKTDIVLNYQSGNTGKALILRNAGDCQYHIYRYANNYANMEAGTRNVTYANPANYYAVDYRNTAGVRTIIFSASYGFYITTTSPTFSSTSTMTPTVTVRRAAINCRCNNNYLTTANCALIDQSTSYIKVKTEVYRVKVGTSYYRNRTDERMNLYRNGIS